MRFGIIGFAVALLVALGVHDAVRATRLAEASSTVQTRLDTLPLVVGDWKGEVHPYDAKMAKAAGAVAYRHVVYNRGGAKPASVSVLWLAGNSGDIGAHDPERCYGGSGHRSAAPRTQKIISDTGFNHSLWCERFEKETLPAGTVEVAWGWTDAGHWQAASDARRDFVGKLILYKIYLSRTVSAESDGDDPIGDLMSVLAPEARKALAAP